MAHDLRGMYASVLCLKVPLIVEWILTDRQKKEKRKGYREEGSYMRDIRTRWAIFSAFF